MSIKSSNHTKTHGTEYITAMKELICLMEKHGAKNSYYYRRILTSYDPR
ncbi:hypothetical protein E2C01_020587 [Portunus trituberculatus]|uniref:Uncharacterized protein n=1 Tax=Portunus trituberculatus TaxID=210409 RepID=A0A5B7E0W6_PORTR|nr:hypothetical protein [Portunus trituberculatus]